MATFLSPLQLQAGAGLLQNQGLHVASSWTAQSTAYTTLPLLVDLINTIANIDLLPATVANLQTLASNSCPALADSIPSAFISNVGNTVDTTFAVTSPTQSDPGMTGMITLTGELYLGNGDNSKFAQIFNSATGYADTTNIFINSAVNANTYLGGTFTDMDNLVTGSLTEVNLATKAFGDDLSNAGQYINLADLANYGSPLALIQQISQRAGTISPLIGPLTDVGVNENIVLNLADADTIITDSVQKLMYKALQNVTGDKLTEILQILDVWTPNINTLADLLNPAVMFPNSYPSLTTPTANGSVAIYITPEPVPAIDWDNISQADDRAILESEAANRLVERPLACEIRQGTSPAPTVNTSSGDFYTPNSNLLDKVAAVGGISYERLSIITDPGLALANKALACSLDQITNVSRVTLPQLSSAYSAVETNKDLDDIDNTQAVPQDDLDYYKNTLALGTGDNGTILMTDILGAAVGVDYTAQLGNCVTIINSLDGTSALDDLKQIYADMYAALPNDAAIELLIIDAQTEIGNIITAYPTETTELDTIFTALGTKLTTEQSFQTKATIDLTGVAANSQQATQGFIQSLPSFGVDTKVGGTAQYLEDVADIGTRYGQAIVATLREGRTTAGLNDAGVGTAANAVPADPDTIPPQAPLIPSVYSEEQARSLVNYG